MPPLPYFNRLSLQLLPHCCPLCLSATHHYLCDGCWQLLPRIINACQQCGLPTTTNQANPICGQCLIKSPPFSRTLVPLLYQTPVDYLIQRFKNKPSSLLGHWCSQRMLESIKPHYATGTPWPGLLVPVPSHWLSKALRGFNPAQGLAELLGKQLNIPIANIVKRQKYAKAAHSQHLNRQSRWQALRGAFTCDKPLHGKVIAVVDDVMTTGATAHIISECLLKQGAQDIHIWALARTPIFR